jgi:hemerythrin-like domain-containing protein
MQARGPLMIEHRLIERMIGEVRKAVGRIESGDRVDPIFIDAVVDFIRTYADRTHHGKEEDILFRELERKSISGGDLRIMQELVEEHVFGRETTQKLVEANRRYRQGDGPALKDVAVELRALVDFYPRHIAKEDQTFFVSARKYFSEKEEQAMLEEFREFDRTMIHEKYTSVVERLERISGDPNP